MLRLLLMLSGAVVWGTSSVSTSFTDSEQPPPRPLVEALQAAYRLPEYTAFDWIGGRYARGTLTLEGFAARPALRAAAERVGRSTAGVDEVDNQIELLPAIQSDDTVRVRAYVAIYTHAGLEQYLPGGSASAVALREIESSASFGIDGTPQFRGPHPIHIVVSGGRVQLFGTVNVSGDRQTAEAELRSLAGVMSVVNRLQVRKR
jgi:hypothetical protein